MEILFVKRLERLWSVHSTDSLFLSSSVRETTYFVCPFICISSFKILFLFPVHHMSNNVRFGNYVLYLTHFVLQMHFFENQPDLITKKIEHIMPAQILELPNLKFYFSLPFQMQKSRMLLLLIHYTILCRILSKPFRINLFIF